MLAIRCCAQFPVAKAADSIFNVSGVLPGIHTGNVAGVPIRPMLADPDTHDFRPKPGSKLEAMGAGVYATSDAVLWTPGPRGGGSGRGVSDLRCDHSGCAHWDVVRQQVEQRREALRVASRGSNGPDRPRIPQMEGA